MNLVRLLRTNLDRYRWAIVLVVVLQGAQTTATLLLPALSARLIDDGVRALDDPRVHALPDRGAKVFVCAYGCQKRKLPLRDAERVTYCGLVVLTDLINGTERFIALN